MTKFHVLAVSTFLMVASCVTVPGRAHGQEYDPSVFLPNQQVRVRDLPTLPASFDKASAVLAAALEVVLHDNAVCCGKDSALADAVLLDFPSLKDLGAMVEGRHLLSDGQPIMVHADYAPQSSVNSGVNIVNALQDQHAALIEWKSQVYVLYGATFNETRYSSGRRQYAVTKLFLLDPRFSDQRRELEFDRETDDWGKVQGVLTLTIKRP